MYIDREKLVASYNDVQAQIAEYALPTWDTLPDLELYMDQVISIVGKYLSIFYETAGEERRVTPSMVNNYVKLGYMPAPVKKKYSKIHLAYLLIICTLKMTLDMATIQKILPPDLSEEEVKKMYAAFVENQHKAYLYVSGTLRTVADPILALEENNQKRMQDLLLQVAASANICKIVTERITRLAEK